MLVCIYIYIYILYNIHIYIYTSQDPSISIDGARRGIRTKREQVRKDCSRNSNKKFDQETLIGRLDQTILQRRAKLCAMCNIVQCGAVLRGIVEVVQDHAILCSCAQVFAELRNCTQ